MESLNKFLNENQDPAAVEKTLTRLSELLTTNEVIEYIAVQKKPVNMSPDSIALTNKRIIFCDPKNFGLSMSFHDFAWKDVKDCHIKEGLMGATFTVTTVTGTRASQDYLPKAQARLLYRYAQEKEEEMRTYRRQQELENARAAAGGVVVQSQAPPPIPQQQTIPDPMESLKNLKQLHEAELISDEEFSSKKAEISKRL